jgi:hypothetical protein
MPNIMEISGLATGGGLKQALQLATIKKLRARRARKAAKKRKKKSAPKRRKSLKGMGAKPKRRRALPGGMTAEKALELAERFVKEGKKPLAIAWARQAENRAKQEGRTAIVRRAQEIVKEIRGVAALKGMAVHGDIEGVVMGRLMGLW